MAYIDTADASVEYNSYWSTTMTELKMMIETRPGYPSNKLTFSITNVTKGKAIPYIDIYLNYNAQFDADVGIDVFLEDSKRNFLNSFLFCFVLFLT